MTCVNKNKQKARLSSLKNFTMSQTLLDLTTSTKLLPERSFFLNEQSIPLMQMEQKQNRKRQNHFENIYKNNTANSKMGFFVALTLHLLAMGTAMATKLDSDVVAAEDKDARALQNTRELQNAGISLAGILDTSNFHWAETIFSVTVDLLNDKNNGFFDDELSSLGPISYQVLDAACEGDTALSQYWLVRPVDGVIGARCSGASIPLAWVGALDNVPQISMSSTSAKLSDKTEFPNFSRVVAPDDERGQVGALISTMNLFGWDRVTIINTDTAYAKDMSTSFQSLWTGEVAYSPTVKLQDGDIDVPSVIKVLKEAPLDDPIRNSKVVLLMGHSQHALPILEIAKDYFPAETFWVSPDVSPNAWAGRELDWMPDVPGYLGIVTFRNRDNVYQQFLQLGGDELARILNDEGHLPEYARETVDAIIAMAMALAATPLFLRDDGKRVAATLRKLDFAGVSGRIRFTIQGDRRDPQYSILNFQNIRDGYQWVDVGSTGTTLGSASFGVAGIQGVCFAGVGCGLDSAPDDSPPVPTEKIAVWVPVVIGLLCSAFLLSFWLYRRKKIKASRKSKAILAAKESELNDFRNSVVDMCTAEEQYIPKLADMDSTNGILPISADTDNGNDVEQATTSARWSTLAGTENGNGMNQVTTNTQWCWRETDCHMHKWDDKMVEGHPSECWVKYDDYSNNVLELAYQAQGNVGQCIPRTGYTVDFSTMSKTNDDTMLFVQTKGDTNFKREVKRIGPPIMTRRDDLSMVRVGQGRPKEIAKEPQMILVPGDIVQISKKRDDGWAYGSKLHQEDEPLGRRLVLLALSGGDVEDDDYVVTDNTGWFPINLTRVPNTDDLAILRKTLGQADDLSAPQIWDTIVDPSVVQKSAPLDRNSQEYQKVVNAFMSTLSPSMIIISVQRIQNMGMWQSYIVKRKTVIDRDKSLQGRASGMQQALARFERSWLWHGTSEDSIEKIIQQGFNRSFCGKNATVYGKGVYFARDASYSSHDTYSPPNSSGHKYILACSVVVGEFCRGKRDARTPDLRDAAKNILYDSTVDHPANASLYVTYHDAQAYPEYVIIYKERR